MLVYSSMTRVPLTATPQATGPTGKVHRVPGQDHRRWQRPRCAAGPCRGAGAARHARRGTSGGV